MYLFLSTFYIGGRSVWWVKSQSKEKTRNQGFLFPTGIRAFLGLVLFGQCSMLSRARRHVF